MVKNQWFFSVTGGKTPYNMEKNQRKAGAEWNRNEWIRSITI